MEVATGFPKTSKKESSCVAWLRIPGWRGLKKFLGYFILPTMEACHKITHRLSIGSNQPPSRVGLRHNTIWHSVFEMAEERRQIQLKLFHGFNKPGATGKLTHNLRLAIIIRVLDSLKLEFQTGSNRTLFSHKNSLPTEISCMV